MWPRPTCCWTSFRSYLWQSYARTTWKLTCHLKRWALSGWLSLQTLGEPFWRNDCDDLCQGFGVGWYIYKEVLNHIMCITTWGSVYGTQASFQYLYRASKVDWATLCRIWLVRGNLLHWLTWRDAFTPKFHSLVSSLNVARINLILEAGNR